jgi:hypothetical protein
MFGHRSRVWCVRVVDGPVEELIVELQARRRGAMVDAFTVTYHTRDGGRYARTFRRALVMCGTRIAPEYC